MAQRALRRDNAPVAVENTSGTMSDEQWNEMLRVAGARVKELSDEEARAIFDGRARQVMGMGGAEFVRRYDEGEFDDFPDDADHTDFMWLEMSLPLGQ